MPLSSKVRFGASEFEAASGELWRDGRPVRLQRQPSKLLDLLLAKPGELVTRDDIRRALWGGDTHVDFERSLNFCVARLRSALRDNPAEPRYIETLPTRGYRFIAAVTRVAPADPPAGSPTSNVPSAPARRTPDASSAYWIWGLAVISAVVLVVGLVGSSRWPASPPAPPKVVVLPFHNKTA